MPSNLPTSLVPAAIGQYAIVRALSGEQTYLADGPGGRRVVLKMLDEDCLLRGRLHPEIHDRLARVRELAHTAVANLYGVERAGKRVFCVWEYVDGVTLDQHVQTLGGQQELTPLARELAMEVESLHALGIVHGRIHGGNVIIDPTGRVRLTHVSPLLYDDPANDAHDVATLLWQIAKGRGWEVAGTAPAASSLHQLRAGLAEPAAAAGGDRSPRRRILLAALAVAVAGAAVAAGVIIQKHRHTPARLMPPQASPEMLTPATRPAG